MNTATSQTTLITTIPSAPPLPLAKVKPAKALGGPLVIALVIAVVCLITTYRKKA